MKRTIETLEQSNQDFLDLAFVNAQCRADQAFYKMTKRIEANIGPLASAAAMQSNVITLPTLPETHMAPNASGRYADLLKGPKEVIATDTLDTTTFFDYDGDNIYRTNEYERYQQERFAKVRGALGAISLGRISEWIRDYRARPLLRDIIKDEEQIAPVIDINTRRRTSAIPAGRLIAGAVATVTLLVGASGALQGGIERIKSSFGARSATATQERPSVIQAKTTETVTPHEVIPERPPIATIDLSAIYAEVKPKHDAAKEAEAAAAAEEKQKAQAAEAAKTAAAETSISTTPNMSGSSTENRRLAHRIAKTEYGYSDRELECLDGLWGTKESGYKAGILNPDSYAAGVPQAWPGTKIYGEAFNTMSTHVDTDGDLVLSNPDAEGEIRWGLDYIDERADYQGSACNALYLHNTRGWY